MDAIDGSFGALGEWVGGMMSDGALKSLVVDGVIAGVGGVLIFLPQILVLFLFIAILEDLGYMARAAFVMDRFMRAIGLPGKASLPLLVGFGCNVPAVMATRTLGDERDRKTAIMMIPFMSCGARVPVYALFAAAFFPTNGQNLVFALYLVGVLMAVLTGFILKRTLLSGGGHAMVMELPRYHVPTVRNVVIRTWDRLRAFLLGAGKIIVVMVAFLSVLNSISTDGRLVPGDSEDSVLAAIGRTTTVAFEPMGIQDDNWPATVGIFTGVFAKEAVVGTLDSLYTALAESGQAGEDDEAGYDLLAGVEEAVATVPANLADLSNALLDPLGIGIGDVSDLETAAEEQEVGSGTFGAMIERFDGRAGAFAYLLFVLLYFPCAAAMGAVYRELGAAWTTFAALWTTGLAYAAATIFYQAARLPEDPAGAAFWIAAMVIAFAMTVLGLGLVGQSRRASGRATTLVRSELPAETGGSHHC